MFKNNFQNREIDCNFNWIQSWGIVGVIWIFFKSACSSIKSSSSIEVTSLSVACWLSSTDITVSTSVFDKVSVSYSKIRFKSKTNSSFKRKTILITQYQVISLKIFERKSSVNHILFEGSFWSSAQSCSLNKEIQ